MPTTYCSDPLAYRTARYAQRAMADINYLRRNGWTTVHDNGNTAVLYAPGADPRTDKPVVISRQIPGAY